MMITYSNALHSVVAESLEADVVVDESTRVRDALVYAVGGIGRVRLWSMENDARLNFRVVDAGAYLGPDLEFDLAGYLMRLLEVSASDKARTDELLDVSANFHSQASIAELAVGHDFVAVLDAYTAAMDGRERIGSRLVASMLRLAFDATHFRKTALSQAMCNWEDATGFEVLSDDARP